MNRRRNSAIATGLAGLLALGSCFDPIRNEDGQIVRWQYNEARTTEAMVDGVEVALVVGSVGMAAMGGMSDNPALGLSSRITGLAMRQAAKGINGNNAGAVVAMKPYFTDQFVCVEWEDRNRNGCADSNNEFVRRGKRFYSEEKITLVSKISGGVGHRITCNLVDMKTGSSTIYDVGMSRFPEGQVNFVFLGPKNLPRGVYEARWFIDGETMTRHGFVVDDGDKPVQTDRYSQRQVLETDSVERRKSNEGLESKRDSASSEREPVRLSVSSNIGVSPLLLSYSAVTGNELERGSYCLWTLDKEPISNGRSGQTQIVIPGEHVLSVLVTGEDGREYRSSRKITVLQRVDDNN